MVGGKLLAKGFCLPYQYPVVDIRISGHRFYTHCIFYGQFSIYQSGTGKSRKQFEKRVGSGERGVVSGEEKIRHAVRQPADRRPTVHSNLPVLQCG